MQSVKGIHWTGSRPWHTSLASLLPIWLLSVTILAEGFPRPPISVEVASISLVLAIATSVFLLWKRWTTVELILYSLVPLALQFAFDEISTTYKTPFIVSCAFILTAGIVGYQCSPSKRWRWLILLGAAVVTLAMAWHAALSFWRMADALGYERCFPDAYGCAPLTGQETPWWVLFFGL